MTELESNSARKKRLAREHNERYEKAESEKISLREKADQLHEATGVPMEPVKSFDDRDRRRRNASLQITAMLGLMAARAPKYK